MFSYAVFIYLRCYAYAVGKIAMGVTESQVLLVDTHAYMSITLSADDVVIVDVGTRLDHLL